ncbi:hypothetical protein BST23_04185 [Mycolicibacterium elephantis]|uniref:Uncharacterized protein n=1 Tax=Mycolicibacterium elephantis TaxID=81858 RepID=A0A1X0D7G0_9MYCO|nr:hypothetical protein [Mycolicibacterium elephantis]ORA68287.1 hypothetical protein BST23_04185 [Mycolicibacterium elephantis]
MDDMLLALAETHRAALELVIAARKELPAEAVVTIVDGLADVATEALAVRDEHLQTVYGPETVERADRYAERAKAQIGARLAERADVALWEAGS